MSHDNHFNLLTLKSCWQDFERKVSKDGTKNAKVRVSFLTRDCFSTFQ